MDLLVQELLDKSISKATRSVYQSGWRQYSRFCDSLGQSPLPLMESTLCRFAAVMSRTVTWGTIKSYLSALRFFQIRSGLPGPSLSPTPRLTYVLKEFTSSLLNTNENIDSPLPCTCFESFTKPPVHHDSVMLWAACCLGFFGFLHAGEFTCPRANFADPSLSPSDIMVDSRDNPQFIYAVPRQTHLELAVAYTLVVPTPPPVLWQPSSTTLAYAHHHQDLSSYFEMAQHSRGLP